MMNQNLDATREWYMEHDKYGEFLKRYVCSECKYGDACYGITDDSVRESCESFKWKKHKEPARWAVSYNIVPAYGSLPLRERIRREG